MRHPLGVVRLEFVNHPFWDMEQVHHLFKHVGPEQIRPRLRVLVEVVHVVYSLVVACLFHHELVQGRTLWNWETLPHWSGGHELGAVRVVNGVLHQLNREPIGVHRPRQGLVPIRLVPEHAHPRQHAVQLLEHTLDVFGITIFHVLADSAYNGLPEQLIVTPLADQSSVGDLVLRRFPCRFGVHAGAYSCKEGALIYQNSAPMPQAIDPLAAIHLARHTGVLAKPVPKTEVNLPFVFVVSFDEGRCGIVSGSLCISTHCVGPFHMGSFVPRQTLILSTVVIGPAVPFQSVPGER
mmetsp:Transcript_10120/g.30297  ORF Transcript_10120/g.30297 Transcript_10120/m.30297 type:complete len:294 (+) Transcript_10120:818-1699(+)